MQKLICIKNNENKPDELPLALKSDVSVTYASCCREAMELMRQQHFDGVYLCGDGDQSSAPNNISVAEMLESSAILDLSSDGIALLDSENKVLRTNDRLTSWFKNLKLVGLNFYEAIGQPTILGPEPSPLATSRSKRQSSQTTIAVNDRYFLLRVVPIIVSDGPPERLLVSLSDSTQTVLKNMKFEALHRAGIALADLRPEEISQMDVEQRIELLKDNILHYAKDLLNFDVVEIRLVDQESGRLEPLLSLGINAETSRRP